MILNRRRFLSISAASLVASPALGQVHRWQGYALGAAVEITLHAPSQIAEPALEHARALIGAVEQQFSLYDEHSVLVRLNAAGHLQWPDPMMQALMASCGRVHEATGGLFDPTVQPLWRALAEGGDGRAARGLIGWERVRHDARAITLERGQALTFNGIAQGYATDLVADALVDAGLEQTLVNIGEFRGTGGPWTLGISDPVSGHFGTRTLNTGAIATSSPSAVPLTGQGHILHSTARPLWSTVSVEAETAVMADGFSTALTLAPLEMIRALSGSHGIRRVTLVDAAGEITTV